MTTKSTTARGRAAAKKAVARAKASRGTRGMFTPIGKDGETHKSSRACGQRLPERNFPRPAFPGSGWQSAARAATVGRGRPRRRRTRRAPSECVDDGRAGTAVGTTRLVIADGDLLATVTPLWSDTDGMRVSIDTTATSAMGINCTEDMTPAGGDARGRAARRGDHQPTELTPIAP